MRVELQNLPEPQWFHHGEHVLRLLEIYRPKVCVELGTNTGGSAIAVARIIRQWGGKLYCIDLWNQSVSINQVRWNIEHAGVQRIISLVQADSVQAATMLHEMIDYLYVDADHTKEGCLADLRAWWPYLKVGGLVAGDDYDDPHGNPSLGVTAAWDQFEKEMDQQFVRQQSEELIGCQCEPCKAGRLIWGVKR